MKLTWLLPIAFCAACIMPEGKRPMQEAPVRRPVLVELFTSEGCSSCPPAERYLNEITARPDRERLHLIPIAYHVDYWDRLGWKDRFSQASFTARQQEYRRAFGEESVYTPQMVVSGREGFTGSDRKIAEKVFRSVAEGDPALNLDLKISRPAKGKLVLNLSLPEDFQHEEDDRLYLVWTQDSLQSKVEDGENKGKSLVHQAVAVALMEVSVQDQVMVDDPSGSKAMERRLVAFIQNKENKHVKAVAEAHY